MLWAALERIHAKLKSEQLALLLWKVCGQGYGSWNEKDAKDQFWDRDDQEYEETWISSTVRNQEEEADL